MQFVVVKIKKVYSLRFKVLFDFIFNLGSNILPVDSWR